VKTYRGIGHFLRQILALSASPAVDDALQMIFVVLFVSSSTDLSRLRLYAHPETKNFTLNLCLQFDLLI
jgi:hypothetical protein